MINSIIDTYHGNAVDVPAVVAGGVVAIIHKATQGKGYRDPRYQQRRVLAKQANLLWGAYHFSTGEPVADQVENFLTHAQPTDDEVIALDWEPSDGPDMTLAQVRDFVQLIKGETGRWPMLYGGHLLRESVGHLPDAILANCPLWYARYADSPIGIPTQVWKTYTLWQYTDGVVGQLPHDTPGTSGADRNMFDGSVQGLRAAWPFTKKEDGVGHSAGFAHIVKKASAKAKPKGKAPK